VPRRHCGVRRSDGSEPDYISPTQRIQAHLAATVTITSINMPDSNSSASTPDHAATSRRRPIPRKGHTKSRAGCPNCKRRKVKCDGRQPCGSCLYYRVPDACEYRQRSRRNAVSRRCVVRHASPDQRLPTASGQLTRTPLKHV